MDVSKSSIFIGSSSPALVFSPARLVAWSSGSCASQPSVCSTSGTDNEPLSSEFYSTEVQGANIKLFPFSGQLLDLWVSAVSPVSKPGSNCQVDVSASGSHSIPSQTLSVNESTIRPYPIQFVEYCDQCSVLFNLTECTNAGSLFFGGISIPSDGQLVALCDQDISFMTKSDWSTATNTTDVANLTCSSTEAATISSHTTDTDGASFSLAFNGTGIAISGTIEVTTYSVTVDNKDCGTHPSGQVPTMLHPLTLFTLSNLNPGEHTLSFVNHRNGSNDPTLTIDSIQILTASPSPVNGTAGMRSSSISSSNAATAAAHDSKPPTEVIAGAITGAVVGALLIALTSFFLLRLRRMRSGTMSATRHNPNPNPSPMDSSVRDRSASPFIAPQQSTPQEPGRGDRKEPRRVQPANTTSSAADGTIGSHSITIPPSSVDPSQTDSGPRNGGPSSSGDSELARTQQRVQVLEHIIASFAARRATGVTNKEAPPSYSSVQVLHDS